MPRRQRGQAAIERTNQVLQTLTIEYLPVASVRPNDYNPNRQSEHEFALLKKSIEEDGFTQPVIVGEDMVIVDGEHRWRAAQELGIDPIPVVVTPMTAEQRRIATLRHNRARGSEDVGLATEVLRDLERLGALDWAADSLDLSDVELQRLLDDLSAPDALAGDEFSEAWAPTAAPDVLERADGRSSVDTSPAASVAIREREERLRQATSEEERAAIRRDADVYRLALTFAADEAVQVRQALGDQPAVNLLAVVRFWLEHHPA